jgi:hypothetical protein
MAGRAQYNNQGWQPPPGRELDFPEYEYRAYPKMLFHAERGEVVVHSAVEHARLAPPEAGWCDSPAAAQAFAERLALQVAEAAAVRAYDDRRLSERAQEEQRALDRNTFDDVLDPPVPPRRPRPAKKKDTAS